MILPLVYYGSRILRGRALPVEEITEEIHVLVRDMIETMDHAHGIGLAAPQVGRSLRLFVLRNYIEGDVNERFKLSDPQVYINPKITILDVHEELDTEGCLSIPGIRGQVPRPIKIRIEALDLEGNVFSEEINGYNARVRLHENDHLNGVLFIDRMHPHARRLLNADLRVLEKKLR